MKKVTLSARAAGTAGIFLLMLCGMSIPASAADKPSKPIKIIYTNDVHCGIEDGIGYAGVAQMEKVMKANTPNVTLVDAGDAIQGTPVGTISEGQYIIDLMNDVGYDVAVPGNHEFDYGMSQFLKLAGELNCGYTSCNFMDLKTGNPVFKAYTMEDYGDVQVAFVGVSTPETFTKSTPAYFQDSKGKYIYGFCEDSDGTTLYQHVQSSVDDARKNGADYVILVGHLGEDGITEAWTGANVIAHTNGIDALIDGHSHETIAKETVKNKDGEDVILTQTGTKLGHVGVMTINTDGELSTMLEQSVFPTDDQRVLSKSGDTAGKLAENAYGSADCWTYIADKNPKLGLTSADTVLPEGSLVEIPTCIMVDSKTSKGRLIARDIAVDEKVQKIKTEYSSLLSAEVGKTDFPLSAKDESGKWLVRTQETGLSDLCADAVRAAGGTEIGFVNGGGIRTNIAAGSITKNDVMSVFPFNNMLCTAELTGQQILDMLEMGASHYPQMSGGFIHPSGFTYTINSSIPSSVVTDAKGMFVSVNGPYRVSDVMVGGKPLDLNRTYTVTSLNYYLKSAGDGMSMLPKGKILRDEFIPDADALSSYISSLGTIPAKYAAAEGRITIK